MTSETLRFAVEMGKKPKRSYPVAEMAEILGFHVDVLRRENKAGRLKFVMPRGKEREAHITCDEADRWIAENTI